MMHVDVWRQVDYRYGQAASLRSDPIYGSGSGIVWRVADHVRGAFVTGASSSG